jgi:hypothetical protein
LASEPGTAASARTISRACANDTLPDATAALVAGHPDNARVVANDSRAWPGVAPAVRATHSTSPRSHSTARAAARVDAAVHAFAARANSSASRAQSSPDQRSASNRAAASRTSTNNSDNRATTLLRTTAPEKKVVEPDPEAYQNPTEHTFGVQEEILSNYRPAELSDSSRRTPA